MGRSSDRSLQICALEVMHFVNNPIDEPIPAPIALHLINAGFASGDLSYTYQMSGVFAQLFEVLERAYDRPFDGDNVNTARFTKP